MIWLGTRQQLSKLSATDKTLCLPDSTLVPSSVVKNLGVYIDEQISMEQNARQCAKTCYFHMRRIRQLRRLVDRDTLHTLVRSLVLGRLDYCNGLLAGCTSSTLHRLQCVQDAAARLVCSAAARTHARPLLQQLHWLPIDCRIQYKLCTLMFDVQHGTAPVYLTELCEPCSDTRLRSSSRCNFTVPRTKLHLSDKAFSVAGPRAWNSLPISVRSAATKDTCVK